MIFKGYRPRIAMRITKDDQVLKRWLCAATFAKTNNGYWLAWHEGDDIDRVAFLTPNHPAGDECRWLDSWDKDDTIDSTINYFESGEFEADKEEPTFHTLKK